MSLRKPDVDGGGRSGWAILGLGGVLSLCCLLATPAATGTVGGVAAGRATNALGGPVIQILVTALTVGILGFGYRLARSG